MLLAFRLSLQQKRSLLNYLVNIALLTEIPDPLPPLYSQDVHITIAGGDPVPAGQILRDPRFKARTLRGSGSECAACHLCPPQEPRRLCDIHQCLHERVVHHPRRGAADPAGSR